MTPGRTSDPREARALLRRDGAAILTRLGADEAAARAVATAVLGDTILAVPEPAAVREGGDRDKIQVERSKPLILHSDGFAYGNQQPDFIFLLCVQDGTSGGESFLDDGYELVESLDEGLRTFLTEVPADQTEPGMRENVSPIVVTLPNGRIAVRQPFFCRPAPGRPESDADLIAAWRHVVEERTAVVDRFRLAPGEALCLDNLRMLHGRDPYEGERFLWRIWAWTTEGNGVPQGTLHSDSRYASAP